MPVKRRVEKQRRQELTELERCLLLDEDPPPGTNEMTVYFLEESGTLVERWEQFHATLLELFIRKHPCARPVWWWNLSAPRVGDSTLREWGVAEEHYAWQPENRIAEPRRRLGGIGTPSFEVLNVGHNFTRGIPDQWVTEFDATYYRGIRRDIHGNLIGQEFVGNNFTGVPLDPNDPPRFESEACYLRRHNLLSARELQYLAEHPELLQDETLKIDEEEDE